MCQEVFPLHTYFPHISNHALFFSCTSASVNSGRITLLIVSSSAFACISSHITSRLVLLICPELKISNRLIHYSHAGIKDWVSKKRCLSGTGTTHYKNIIISQGVRIVAKPDIFGKHFILCG